MSQPLVISLILNTNRRDDTLECLGSLYANSYQNHRAIVLDNHSTDGSVEAIRAAFPGVEIINLVDNRGYTGNNNVGITQALQQGAGWVFVLNEDTVLAQDCLEHLVAVGEGDPHIGIVGPMVYHHDEPTVIQSAGGKLGPHWNSLHLSQNQEDQGQWIAPHSVDFITGCGILIRRAVIEQVSMFDERFFYYKEETELCLRSRRHGWKCVNVPQARLWHKGVQRVYHPKPYVTYYATRNLFLMLAKHNASHSVWIRASLQTLRTLTSWSIRPKWRIMREHRNAMWRGIVDYLRSRWGQMPA